MKYESPAFQKKAFTCSNCGVYANFFWKECKEESWAISGSSYIKNGIHIASCSHCEGKHIWYADKQSTHLIWPFDIGNAPPPHDEMPDEILVDYIEARNICRLSPRGAAALLRLAIQKLCKQLLGFAGKDLNADIGSLVKNGLPIKIQQALDIVRVTGNHAVHPGELSFEDNPEIANSLFSLINLIVDNQIAEPKRIQSLYDGLPNGALKKIEQRDS